MKTRKHKKRLGSEETHLKDGEKYSLMDLDNELQIIQDTLLKSGYSHNDIRHFAGPILSPITKIERNLLIQKCLKCIILIIFFITILYCLSFSSFISGLFRMVTKISTSMVLFKLVNGAGSQGCLIENPFFILPMDKIAADCSYCENVTKIAIINGSINNEDLYINYIAADVPTVLKVEEIDDWPIRKFKMNPKDVIEWSLKQHEMVEDICYITFNGSKIPEEKSTQQMLEEQVNNNWLILWENCVSTGYRKLRELYKRPKLFPGHIDWMGRNWLFLSRNFKQDFYEPVSLGYDNSSLITFYQVWGFSKLILIPNESCEETCTEIKVELQEQEVLIYTKRRYDLLYASGDNADSVAIAMEGFMTIR